MIKGLMMTPPVMGRISIGKLVERNGRLLPEKDDEFTLTTQVQTRAGWALHPLDGILRNELQQAQHDRAFCAGMQVSESAFTEGQGQHAMQATEPRNDGSVQPLMPKDDTSSLRPHLQAKLQRKLQRLSIEGMAAEISTGTGSTKATAAAMATAAAVQHTDAASGTTARIKLRSIPVRLLFNDPDLNLRANYTLFDRATARPLCVGDGQQCKRRGPDGIQTLECPSPEHCALAAGGQCKLFARLHVRIDHPDSGCDELGTFVLRTTSVNTVRTLMARMRYLQAFSAGQLAYLPLELRLRGKSTTMSHRAPIYYVDLGLRQHMGMAAAMAHAQDAVHRAQTLGLDQAALDAVAKQGYVQGLFEETAEDEQDVEDVLREFYPHSDAHQERARDDTGASHGGTQR